MKKILVLALAVLSIGFISLPAQAKATESSATNLTANAAPAQIRVQIGNRRGRRVNRRVIRRTRITPYGRRVVTTRRYNNGRRVVVRRTVRRPYRRY